jgi:hypothetical protein
MRPADRLLRAAILAGSLALSACASNPRTPPGFLPDAERARSDAYGGWLVAEIGGGSEIEGELIAVGRDTVFVLVARDGDPAASRLAAVRRDQVRRARLVKFDPRTSWLTIWAIVGGATSPLVNGAFSIFTAPAWATAGIFGARAANKASRLEIPEKVSWEEASAHARFPQGLPPSLARSELRPKPHAD